MLAVVALSSTVIAVEDSQLVGETFRFYRGARCHANHTLSYSAESV